MADTTSTTTPAAGLAVDSASLATYLAQAQVFVTALGPVLPPKVGALLGLAAGAFAAAQAAATGKDVTDDELDALFAQFEINKADDLAAQAEARQREAQAAGGAGTG